MGDTLFPGCLSHSNPWNSFSNSGLVRRPIFSTRPHSAALTVLWDRHEGRQVIYYPVLPQRGLLDLDTQEVWALSLLRGEMRSSQCKQQLWHETPVCWRAAHHQCLLCSLRVLILQGLPAFRLQLRLGSSELQLKIAWMTPLDPKHPGITPSHLCLDSVISRILFRNVHHLCMK